MKRGKKSHYSGNNGRAACKAHVPSYRIGPYGKVKATCKVCTRLDRRGFV